MKMKYSIYLLVVFCITYGCDKQEPMVNTPEEMEEMEEMSSETFTDTIRFASYNVAMYGNSTGEILAQLETAQQQIKLRRLAAVIKKVRPDVLVLMEVDYDSEGKILDLFRENLLSISLDNFEGIDYPYAYQIQTNTGLISEVDIDGNGNVSLPNDAYGFGNYEGQYASAILSKYPIDISNQRSFQKFLWKNMPDATLPQNLDGSSYYSEEVLNVFRLSSKNHIDLPLQISDEHTVHALISHPTPPVFDGDEDRNGKRNHDEIKLWADYISNENYLVDDNGVTGGLNSDESFMIFGDLNADPVDGDSYNNAISLLIDHPRVNQDVTNGALIPSSNGGTEHNESANHEGDPAYDTSFFGLRIDYVMPSKDLTVIDSGVFWPASNEESSELVQDGAASDHLLVWVDVEFK